MNIPDTERIIEIEKRLDRIEGKNEITQADILEAQAKQKPTFHMTLAVIYCAGESCRSTANIQVYIQYGDKSQTLGNFCRTCGDGLIERLDRLTKDR